MRRPDMAEAAGAYFLSSAMVVAAGLGGTLLQWLGCGRELQYFFYTLTMAAFMLLPAMALDRQGTWLGLEKPHTAAVALCAAAAVVAAFALTHLGNIQFILLKEMGYAPAEGKIPPSNGFGMAAFGFYSVVMASVCEEIVMRGTVLRAVERQGSWRAIIASAALFALLHGRIESLVQSFLAGIMLGFAAVATRSVITSIVMHSCYNATVIAMTFMSPEWRQAMFGEGILYSAVSAVVMAMIILALMAATRQIGKGEFVKGERSSPATSAIILLAAGVATMLCIMALNFIEGLSL